MFKGIVLSLLTVFSVNSYSLDFNIAQSGNDVIVDMTGDFDKKSHSELVALTTKYPDNKIIMRVNSLGGYANNITDVMDTITRHGNIYWEVNGRCASMCAFAGIAAKSVKGTLEFHGITNTYTNKLDVLANVRLSSKLSQMGVKSIPLLLGPDLVAKTFD